MYLYNSYTSRDLKCSLETESIYHERMPGNKVEVDLPISVDHVINGHQLTKKGSDEDLPLPKGNVHSLPETPGS